jgi:hypothetical protein
LIVAQSTPPDKPMKLMAAFGARSFVGNPLDRT